MASGSPPDRTELAELPTTRTASWCPRVTPWRSSARVAIRSTEDRPSGLSSGRSPADGGIRETSGSRHDLGRLLRHVPWEDQQTRSGSNHDIHHSSHPPRRRGRGLPLPSAADRQNHRPEGESDSSRPGPAQAQLTAHPSRHRPSTRACAGRCTRRLLRSVDHDVSTDASAEWMSVSVRAAERRSGPAAPAITTRRRQLCPDLEEGSLSGCRPGGAHSVRVTSRAA